MTSNFRGGLQKRGGLQCYDEHDRVYVRRRLARVNLAEAANSLRIAKEGQIYSVATELQWTSLQKTRWKCYCDKFQPIRTYPSLSRFFLRLLRTFWVPGHSATFLRGKEFIVRTWKIFMHACMHAMRATRYARIHRLGSICS